MLFNPPQNRLFSHRHSQAQCVSTPVHPNVCALFFFSFCFFFLYVFHAWTNHHHRQHHFLFLSTPLHTLSLINACPTLTLPSFPACVFCVCSRVRCMAWLVTFDPWPLTSGSLRHSGRWGVQSVSHQFGLRYRKRRSGIHTCTHFGILGLTLYLFLVFFLSFSLFLYISSLWCSTPLSLCGKSFSWNYFEFPTFFFLLLLLPSFLPLPGSFYPLRAPVEENRHDGWRGFPHLSHLHGL